MIRAGVLMAVLAAPAMAQPLDSVPRPEPRATAPEQLSVPRPSVRPEAPVAAPTPTPQPVVAARPGAGICNDPAISGTPIEAIPGRVEGCGIERPVRVQAVSGVRLDRPVRMDCTTATALKTWVEEGVKPVLPRVTALDVAAGYVCRTINHQEGANISEHGKGRAIDISAFFLDSGERLTVLDGWRDDSIGPRLSRIHAAACGPFATVLGPEADRYHQDHFHLDTSRRGGSPYCR